MEDTDSMTEVVVSYQNAGFCKEFYENDIGARWINNSASSIPLRIHIDSWNDLDSITLSYDFTEVFKTQHNVKLFNERILSIARTVVRETDITIGNISTLTENETKLILEDFNQTDAQYPTDKTVVDLFEEQVEKTPDHIAVKYGEETITYRELNKKANKIANRLRTEGIGREDYVALYVERSIEMIVGIYAVMKAGAAYVPINLSYPKERVQFILKDCNAKVLLTGKEVENIETEIPMFNIKDSSIYTGSDVNPEKINKPEDAIYVIFTSGTTGTPKGVVLEHKNVVRLLKNDHMKFDFNDGDVWTMFHAYGFDFSVWEMYGATLNGGKLIVLSEEEAQDTKKLLEILKKEKVTVFNQVPSAFYNLLRTDGVRDELKIRYLIFGGEALSPAKMKEWKSWHPETKIINMYGITETCVHVTYREIGEKEIERGVSDIGNAIPTLKVYLMNEERLCGIGEVGEICVTGEGLARGYLKQKEMTDKKFVKNPFGEGRMYRSGDLGRWNEDGNIEYLGRMDEQVKVRGFRIELGDIERHLREIDGIDDCAVISKKDENGEVSICAYLVSKQELEIVEVKQKLSETVPSYMLPAYMMQIESLPLTVNGKLDKKNLPEIKVQSRTKYVAPRNEMEEVICSIAEEVLGISKIGINDNLYELGCDSIKTVRISNKLQQYGYVVSIREILGSYTMI